MPSTTGTGKGAGRYWQVFLWLVANKTTGSTYGNPKYTWPTDDAAELWGYVRDLSSSRQLVYSALNNRVGVELHLRGWNLDVSPLDRLQDKDTGTVYMLDGGKMIDRHNNEIVFTAHRGADVQ